MQPRDMLRRLEKRWAEEEHVDATRAAHAYAGLGDAVRVCALLNQAYEERDAEMPWLFRADPLYDPVRDAARLQDLLRRMNFPPQDHTARGGKEGEIRYALAWRLG